MSDNVPATDANGQAPTQMPPFNEVAVLFPLLTIYTAADMALMIAGSIA